LVVNASNAQDLRLEISVPKTKIGIKEPVNLTIKLANTSAKTYYVSGDIALGIGGFGHQFGTYQLQVRKAGASDFTDGPQMFGSPLRAPGASDSSPVSDFLVANRLIPMEPGAFIGRTISSDWDGLTLLELGRYSIRVTYSSYGAERLIPRELRFPIFRAPLTSNVIDLEIQP
jgi:hypothetical protein